MAAYAALVSLMNLIEQVKLYHARNPICSEQQLMRLETLHGKVSFLQNFLEIYSNNGRSEGECLESKIADAVYGAEDLIESHIVYLGDHFSQKLLKVIDDVDIIQREALQIQADSSVDDKQPRAIISVAPPPLATMDRMAVFDASLMNQITKKLTGKPPSRQTIQITGMGGIGKTTLAKSVYDNPLVKRYFDVHGFITVSQEFNPRKILSGLLHDMKVLGEKNKDENIEYHVLGDILHKHLSGRRYLIVLDDIWSEEAWDKVSIFLPDNDKLGSRVMVTTRQQCVANYICSSTVYEMNLLDENQCWSLLQTIVFVQGSCPVELEGIGKMIAGNCKGLPLSIAVIGRVLSKSMDREYWKNIAKDISACVNSEDDQRYFQILYTSYRHMPIHLKPCFLYLGIYPEDYNFSVSRIIKLWVADGFLKPQKGKSLEDVANDYLKELIDRNLISVNELRSVGNHPKSCKMHDLLRDLCLREAKKQRFRCATKTHSPDSRQKFSRGRRIALHNCESHEIHYPELNHAWQSSNLRSFLCNFEYNYNPSLDVTLLRVWRSSGSEEVFPKLFNKRYLNLGNDRALCSTLPSSIHLFWNLQTLVMHSPQHVSLPSDIWEMPQLRHIMVDACEIADPRAGNDNIVLENFRTLSTVTAFRCSDEVLKKIPNIKKLTAMYLDHEFSYDYFKNLGRLANLESLKCYFFFDVNGTAWEKLEFPPSLKKLHLVVDKVFNWDYVGKNIGSLPLLEKLKLHYDMSDEEDNEEEEDEVEEQDQEWNSVEGQFPRLRFLEISTENLVSWTAESCDFPYLESLSLLNVQKLEEIPSEIGDIPALRSIALYSCSDHVIASAKKIQEEQMIGGNEELLITIGK